MDTPHSRWAHRGPAQAVLVTLLVPALVLLARGPVRAAEPDAAPSASTAAPAEPSAPAEGAKDGSAQSDTAPSDAARAETAPTDAGKAEAAPSDSAKAEATSSEAGKSEPAPAEAVKAEPAKSEAPSPEAVKSKSSGSEAVKAEPAKKPAAKSAQVKGGPARSAAQAAPAEPAEDADSVLGPEPPTRVRVAILNATGKSGGANKVALLLTEYMRRALEDRIGLQLDVVNVSSAESVRPGQSIVFYRPEFLRAALAMAKAIPGSQFVEPMRPAGLKRAGVDVEIVVGKELP